MREVCVRSCACNIVARGDSVDQVYECTYTYTQSQAYYGHLDHTWRISIETRKRLEAVSCGLAAS